MAMPLPPMETQAKVASEAAQNFVDHYYEALNRRHNLGPFYASTSNKLTAASVKPDISINGNVCETVADFEHLLNQQGSPVYWRGREEVLTFCGWCNDIGSFDAHPVNAHFTLGAPPPPVPSGPGDPLPRAERRAVEAGDRITVAVQVSGTVRYGKAGAGSEDGAAPVERAFNEAWLLVPHWEAWARNAPRGLKRWVAVSQNFRTL